MAIPSKKEQSKKDASEQGLSTSLTDEFTALATLFEQLKALYPSIDTLSMGMSNDQAEAIKHGSTMVRIGTAIFGARN